MNAFERNSSPSSTDGPILSGLRVLDFTHILAGPFCTRMLADLGADVLKVESATKPERMGSRKSSSNAPKRTRVDRTPSFLNTNRSKRSITINLKTDAGRRLAQRLAEVADVVTENFSAGVMDRLQLGYERLQPRNPKLIYISMSGYGHSGPRMSWTSMNMNLQAYTGLMMATGDESDPPTCIANSWNDYIGGLHACFAILQAIANRNKSGKGRLIDLSQFECSVASFGPLLLSGIVNRTPHPRQGNRSTLAAPQGVYRCAGDDQWCAISIQNDSQWLGLTAAMGTPSWAGDPRYKTVQGRLEAQDELDARIESWTVNLTKEQVEEHLKNAGIPAERVRRINEVLDPLDGSRVFQPWNDPRAGAELTTVLPFSFSENPLAAPRAAAAMGEHTQESIKEWLRLSDSEIKNLEEQGALI